MAAAAMGRAAAAAAATASELLSEPRASEHEGGSHTGVREGPTARRVLSASRDLASRATRGGYCSGTRDDGEWRLATSRRGRLASKYPWEREAQVTQVTVCRKRPERRHICWRAHVHTVTGLASWAAGWMLHSPELMKAKSESRSSLRVSRKVAINETPASTFSNAMEDTNSSAVNCASCHGSDPPVMVRAVGLPRANNSAAQRRTLHLA